MQPHQKTRRGDLPVKVLFVTPFSWLYGSEVCLLKAVTYLDRKVFEPTVILGGEGPLFEKLQALEVPVKKFSMPYMTQKGRQGLDFLRAVLPASGRIAHYIRQNQFDLVYNNTLQNPYGILAARFAGVPSLWHIHEMAQNPLLRLATTSVLGTSARQIVVVAQAVKTIIPAFLQHKIEVIYNGVEPNVFNPRIFDRQAIRQELAIQPTQPVVGIIGRLHPSKRHLDLLQAMAQIQKRWQDCLLMILGDGSPDFEQELRSAVEHLGLGDNVRFLGFRSDVRKTLAALDVLVLPSDREAFPMVLLEAMAMEKPVIATSVGGMVESVSQETGFLVPVGHTQALVEAISSILTDRKQSLAMGKRGREKVLQQFSAAHYVKKLETAMLGTLPV